MPKSYVIKDEREYPEYEYREYPKHLGFDAEEQEIVVAHAEEEADRASEVVWPKHLGKDKHGRDVVAMTPAEEGWKSKHVAAQKKEIFEEKPESSEIKRGPGRPPKSDAV